MVEYVSSGDLKCTEKVQKAWNVKFRVHCAGNSLHTVHTSVKTECELFVERLKEFGASKI